jgi:transposase
LAGSNPDGAVETWLLLGLWRWVVERTFAWLNQFRRLRVRYDKRADTRRSCPSAVADLLAVSAKELDNCMSAWLVSALL